MVQAVESKVVTSAPANSAHSLIVIIIDIRYDGAMGGLC